jgi:hypothetical protein
MGAFLPTERELDGHNGKLLLETVIIRATLGSPIRSKKGEAGGHRSRTVDAVRPADRTVDRQRHPAPMSC